MKKTIFETRAKLPVSVSALSENNLFLEAVDWRHARENGREQSFTLKCVVLFDMMYA